MSVPEEVLRDRQTRNDMALDAYRSSALIEISVAGVLLERGKGMSWSGFVGPFQIVVELTRFHDAVTIEFGQRRETFLSLKEANDALVRWGAELSAVAELCRTVKNGDIECDIVFLRSS